MKEKKNIQIVFMGTPEFAVTILKGILDKGYNVVGVITAPDRPAGRGRKIKQSAVKQFAVENNLKVLQPTNLKSEKFLSELKKLNANLHVVVAFRMLPKAVWKMPKYGTFNLHASLLPQYRGAAPINWAIINGEEKTGVTTFFINEKIDTGEIILQKEIEIKADENAGELHNKLMVLGSELVNETINLIQNDKVKAQPQPKKEFRPAPKLNKENCKINWNDTLDNIYNKIRGLSPYPLAWTTIYNKINDKEEVLEMKIYKANKFIENHKFQIGKIIATKKEMKVAVKNGFISINELKVAGKRKMDVKSFLNGYSFSQGAFMK
jgi:methionyl-tRNA formyltransferase